MSPDDLTHADHGGSGRLRAWIGRRLERLSGADRMMHVYERWRQEAAGNPRKMGVLLDMLGTKVALEGTWPPVMAAEAPLVMVANHPFGIGDGIVLAALAERLERPYKVLINKAFMRVGEFGEHCLPIDFEPTEQALRTNLATRRQAAQLLREGVTVLAFPAGTVATAPAVFGRAREAPWKTFTARLVQQARAGVAPFWFEGQNSRLFHAASHITPSLRMSLLIAEFRRFPGAEVRVRAGPVTAFEELRAAGDRQALTDELYLLAHRLAPWAQGLADADLLPARRLRRRPYRWDAPLSRAPAVVARDPASPSRNNAGTNNG